jgi:hypothetical protein
LPQNKIHALLGVFFHVKLVPELVQLTERLAENAHDLWAAQRMAGSTAHIETTGLGNTRVSWLRLSCLNPKKYDREAAMGTPKAILALG